MAFIPKIGQEGKLTQVAAANSTTITKGDALVDNGSGYLTTASAGTAVDVRYVAAETVTTTSTGQLVKVWRTDGVTFEADCDAAFAQTDIGTEADLAAAGQVNPDASTNDIFYIEGPGSSTTKVRGHFQLGVPNS
jgi:hypothetical protein